MYKVEIRNADNSKEEYFWWVIKARNGKILATSEMYTTKRSAYRVAKKLSRAIGCELCYAE